MYFISLIGSRISINGRFPLELTFERYAMCVCFCVRLSAITQFQLVFASATAVDSDPNRDKMSLMPFAVSKQLHERRVEIRL